MKTSRLLLASTLLAVILPATTVYAAFQEGSRKNDVLIGRDNDNVNNTEIQIIPPPPNQSLDNTDIIRGEYGDDILIGLLGDDVLDGGWGDDILIGGTEQGNTPNADVMFGGYGDDISLWAPGDGSDAFIGDRGKHDAQIFGVIDRDQNNVPTLREVSAQHGKKRLLPGAELTNSPGFCTLERVKDPNLGFEFLARFFVRATGNLAVTVRLTAVEQVFCTSEKGGAITYADLTVANPQFVEVSLEQAKQLNRTVGQIIR